MVWYGLLTTIRLTFIEGASSLRAPYLRFLSIFIPSLSWGSSWQHEFAGVTLVAQPLRCDEGNRSKKLDSDPNHRDDLNRVTNNAD